MLSVSFKSPFLRLALSAVALFLLVACGDDQAQQRAEAPVAQEFAAAPAVEAEPVPPLAAETDAEAYASVTDAAAESAPASPAEAQSHTVNALATAFDPMVVFIEPGDSVRWTNMAGHDSRSLEGLIPEGAEHWATRMGDNASITLHVPGVYIYMCTPHYAMGMAAAIVVGDARNLDEVDANATGMARRVVARLKQELEN